MIGGAPMKRATSPLCALLVALALASSAMAQTTSPTPSELADRALHRRAVEAVIWGMPAVNFDLLYQAMVQAKGSSNQVVYWSRLPDWKNQTLTPNPDVIYLMPFFDTKDAGPIVMEIPPAGPMARLPAASTTGGRRRWKMSALQESTRARAENISFCRPALRTRRRKATSRSLRRRIAAMPCCAPILRAAAMRTSPRRSPTASA